ncbi:MAG TPA: helix-turn-helix transcriptional regulator [Vicinamibacterales bacterium]|nr:helix-turn-helix transcriptional regulator [Vicinamibacterales bacterium]
MTKDELRQFAEAVRTARAKLGMNKSEFCKKAGVTPNTLRALERGAQHPNPDTLDRIAKAAGTTVAALTSGRRPIEATDPLLAQLNDEDLEVAQAFHHAPMRVRQRALGVLQERTRPRKESVTHDVYEWTQRLLALDPAKRQAMVVLIESLSETDVVDDAALEIAARAKALTPDQQLLVLDVIAQYEPHPAKGDHLAKDGDDYANRRNRSEISAEGKTPMGRRRHKS